MGWFLQLVVAYTVIDIDSVISSDLGQPWASYLLQVLPQKTALAALGLTIIAAFSMGQGCMVNIDMLHNLIHTPQFEMADCLYRSLPPVSHLLMPVMAASPVRGGFHE